MNNTDDDGQRADVLRQCSESMASAQGWGLVAHACGIRAGHPHAEQMMRDDLAALESVGAMTFILAALGDELGDELGHRAAIDALRQRVGSGTHPARALADAVAESIEYDGERALAIQRDRHTTAEFWQVVDEWRDRPDG